MRPEGEPASANCVSAFKPATAAIAICRKAAVVKLPIVLKVVVFMIMGSKAQWSSRKESEQECVGRSDGRELRSPDRPPPVPTAEAGTMNRYEAPLKSSSLPAAALPL